MSKLKQVSHYLQPSKHNSNNYSSCKLELLALMWTITETFSEYLTGAQSDVNTDNYPLVYLASFKWGALDQR